MAMPKLNGAKPVVKPPNVQKNDIKEANNRPSITPNALSSSTPSIVSSVANKNGPILAKVENHIFDSDKHLAVNPQNQASQLFSGTRTLSSRMQFATLLLYEFIKSKLLC